MTALNRRTMFLAGLGSAVAVSLVADRATAEHYPADAGEPVPEAKGNVRRVDLSERPSTIPAYTKVRMLDIVFSPGSSEPVEEMMADMVCHCTQGELTVTNDGWPLTVALRHAAAAPNCTAARAVGLAPANRGQLGYYPEHDRDRDGIACEPWPRR